LDTLERLAIETGISTWAALEQAIRQRLLPQRALTALEGFQRMINDARALLEPGFAEKLTADVTADIPDVLPEDSYTQSPDAEDEGTDFAFGEQGTLALSQDEPVDASFSIESFAEEIQEMPAEFSFNPFEDVAPRQ